MTTSETYTSNQFSGFTAGGSEIQYKIKSSQYIYSDANKLLKLVETMRDAASMEVLEKTTKYIYDNNGNQLAQKSSYIRPAISVTESFHMGYYTDITSELDNYLEITDNVFDGFNRLKKVDNIKKGARVITEFTYDGDDLRVSKTVKSSSNNYQPEVTNYLYDRQHVILETDASNNIKVRYIRGINYIARIDNSNRLSYFLYNGHGDVVQTAAENGTVENQYEYDIFGNVILTIESYSNAIRYAGEYMDESTGLYYLRARYYDSYTGRFMSEDSYWGEDVNPLSLNLYTYCHNNPISYVDPTGHSILSAFFAPVVAVKVTTGIINKVIHESSKSTKKTKENKEAVSEVSVKSDIPKAVLADVAPILLAYYPAESPDVGSMNVLNYYRKMNKLEDNSTLSGGQNNNKIVDTNTKLHNQNNQLKMMSYSTKMFPMIALGIIGSGGDVSKIKATTELSTTVMVTELIVKKYVAEKAKKVASHVISEVVDSLKGGSTLIRSANPNEIRFSQSSVNGLDEIAASMKKNGWVGDPIDVVRMSDGKLTTIDNTRVLAAREAGIDVKMIVHEADEALPSNFVDRFTTKKGVPTTWEEAVQLRIQKQNSSFRNANPNGAYEMK